MQLLPGPLWSSCSICQSPIYWSNRTVWKLFIFSRNMWNHITVHKLLIFDRNTWYHITAYKQMMMLKWQYSSIGWSCWIHWLLLCKWIRPPPQRMSWYDTKQSDGEIPIMLKLWGMQSTPSLPSLPAPLWLRVAALDRVLSMGQIELNSVLMLNWIAWNRTVFDIGTAYLC